MKDITLKIIGTQVSPDNEEDTVEFVTEGQLYEKNGALYLLYDESELSGEAGCKTTLKIRDNVVRMKRFMGNNQGTYTIMEFEKGKKYSGIYNTPYGPIELEVLTNTLESNLSEEGTGTVNIDYHICLRGLAEGRNKLAIHII